MTTAVDLFCGIGWGFACHEHGIDEHGIDNEPTVAATRNSLGFTTTCADIGDLDPTDWAGVDGIIASPPCQSWSRAGKGLGLDDPRGQLVWQPLVWALAIRPRWVACEQVPGARGAFELIAHRLRDVGYHADVYELSAETFGVPQTRRRVFLTAHRDYAPPRPAQTHQRYRKGVAPQTPYDMLRHRPWVSMADALGCGFVDRPRITLTAGSNRQGGVNPLDGGSGARSAVAEAVQSGRWLNTRCNWMPPFDMAERPAPTLSTVAGASSQWLVGSGTHKPVALTEAQGCALMGFPTGTDQHLAGTKADRWRIIGNAVCPPVAHAVLATIHAKTPASGST